MEISDDIKDAIKTIVAKYLNLAEYRLFIFGSRATGDNRQGSDIDIGIEGAVELTPETLAKIRADLDDLKTLCTFDVVDFKQASPDFYKVAKQNIILLS